MARPRRLNWSQLLEESPTAVVGLDANLRIRVVSPGMTDLTGWMAEDLTSLKCDQAAGEQQAMPGDNPLADLVAAALTPPPACRNGHIVVRDTVLPSRSGQSIRLRATCVPLLDTESDPRTAAGDTPTGLHSEQTGRTSAAGGITDAPVTAILIFLCLPLPQAESTSSRRGLSHLHAEINALRLDLRRRFGTESYIGGCDEMRRALRQAELLRHSAVSFCITGPSGSGRRHLMRLIHQGTPVADHSLIFLDCHLLAPSVLLTTLHQLRSTGQPESHLPHQRCGLLVLTELQSLPIEVQQWMVDQEYLAPDFSDQASSGGARVRLAAISQIPLATLQNEGLLLPKLVSQLSNVEIHLPSLQARKGDILLLFRQFMDEYRRDHKAGPESLAEDVSEQLLEYLWPGQIRELRSVATAACQACSGSQIESHHLPWQFRVAQDAQRKAPPPQLPIVPLEPLLQEFETAILLQTLQACEGNKTEAARRLGLTRPRLYRRMKTLGLESSDDVPIEPSEDPS